MNVVLLFSLLGVCAAQLPQPCHKSKEFQEISRYSYDEVNKRTRAVEEIRQGEERDFFDVLHLHNVNKEYRLNLRTKKCNVTTLTRPFHYRGVPPNSTFNSEGEIGPVQLPDEHLTINNWEGTFEDGTKYMVSVTVPDCVPVLSVFLSQENGFETERYFDIQLGIRDQSVFIPPSECTSL